jgi:hypothetical protein
MTMVTKTVAIYVFFDDILKSMHHKEEKNRKICLNLFMLLLQRGF